MPKPSHHLAFVALTLWLLANWGGAYAHLCFDGQEPPLSMHLQLQHMNDLGHHPDEEHQDRDVDVLQSVLAKLSKIDLGVLLLAIVSLLLSIPPRRIFTCSYLAFTPAEFPHIRPPLRAPPFTA